MQSLHSNVQSSMQTGEKCFPGVEKSGRGRCPHWVYQLQKSVHFSDSGWLRGVKARFSTTLMSFFADDREL